MDKSDALGQEKLTKLIARFAIPSVIGMLISALYNVVDRIFVGNIPDVGGIAFAGITLTYPLTLMVIACSGLFKLGANSVASISLGEGNRKRANKAVNQCFIMNIILGVLFMVIVLGFTDPILRLLGASDVTLPYARDYIRVIAYGAIPNFIGFAMNNFLYTDGSPKMAMGSMLIGGIMNIILDPIFIFYFNQGAKGAAIATIISQFASCIWTVSYFFLKRCSFKLNIAEMKPDFELLKRIWILGMPVFVNQIAHSTSVTVLNTQTAKFGSDMAVTTMGIVMVLSQFTMLPVIGISHGLQPIWGYNYGSKQMDRVIKAFYMGIAWGTAYILVLYSLFMTFPAAVANLFVGSSPVDIGFTARAIRIFLLLEPLIAFELITANFYPSIKMPGKSMLLNVFRQVFALIPLLLILPEFFGLDGILYCGPIGEFLAVVLAVFVVSKDIKKLRKQEIIKSSPLAD